MKSVDVELNKAHLTTLEHSAIQEKLRAEKKRKRMSRRSIYGGGGAPLISELREKIRVRDEKEKVEQLRKAKKKLAQAISKATKALKERGVEARKQERARRNQVQVLKATDQLVSLQLLFPIREPDKNPTPYEQGTMTEEAYPELVLAIKQLENGACNYPSDVDDDNDVQVTVFKALAKNQVFEDLLDSSLARPQRDIISSDVESDTGTTDSICANADFITVG
jgi:hypothetical protein